MLLERRGKGALDASPVMSIPQCTRLQNVDVLLALSFVKVKKELRYDLRDN